MDGNNMKKKLFLLMLAAVALVSCKETKEPDVEVTAVRLSSNAISLVAGSIRQLTAEVVPSNASKKTVSWESSDAAVASVNQEGIVTAVSPGEATVSASAVNGVMASCKVTVTAAEVAVTGVSVSPTEASVMVNATIELTADVYPAEATNTGIVWRTSKENVAVVLDGVVKGLSVGTAVITATTVDGGFQASCTVSVIPEPIAVTGIKLNQTEVTLQEEGSVTLTATVMPFDATDRAISWQSSAPDVCSVSENGFVSALKIGTAIITATTHDGGFTASCTVTIVKKDYKIETESNAEGFGEITDDYQWN